ncbi:Signal transduction histidine kinase [Jatrophihabitans endophyticus]|uniref:histidine kinase n=1 Tax=Jatrophihabitans endophyticus TaxID=1206085 RepID=A0A1M5HJD0_9ACTN|nr:histidine kinase [Jatrophihabitans endophyticus]SHG16064.1 Signal transduction histidine kinase [Jatrophihabitans endophyticus]
MSDTGRLRSGLAYPHLVPATLLPPEDPSRATRTRRTWRDRVVDTLLFLLAAGTGLLAFAANEDDAVHSLSPVLGTVDLLLGGVACVALWGRRRWPVGVGVLTALLSTVSVTSAPASVVGLFGVAVHRRTTVALLLVVVNLGASAVFTLVRPSTTSFWVMMLFSVGFVAVVTAWGMFVRARRQLVWTLRERAERAEAEQRMLAEQARTAERTRIAREMHDVLAHRISMLALHAGGLQLRPDLPPEQVAQTAGLLRETAHQALEELRGVIGVLRESPDGTVDTAPGAPAAAAPQPTLHDIARLVADTRRAGARIEFVMDVAAAAEPPGTLGRDAYRIVQEALTNVAKHATGTATTVRVAGAPGAGLRVQVRNRLPLAPETSLPGSGTGLLGLRERVNLTGGTLEHGPTGAGEFVVDARLTWR